MPVPDQRRPGQRHLLRDDAYSVLCDAIVTGVLAPGETLHDTELCNWLNVSRSPVREALGRLREEGLVESKPQRFTRVAPLAVQDVLDVFPVLAALHALATELAVPRLTRADTRELRDQNTAFIEALSAGDAARAYAADDRFHAVFVAASGNGEIAPLLERLGPRLRRLEHLASKVPPGRRSAAQHQAIIARAAAGDATRAASAVRENWLEFGALAARSFSFEQAR
jgi:DNA-binding GntR family transcriptional regulator